jgi:hypothetical protein
VSKARATESPHAVHTEKIHRFIIITLIKESIARQILLLSSFEATENATFYVRRRFLGFFTVMLM